MKIYFSGSVRGGRDYKKLYSKIVEWLGAYGTVLTEHIANANCLRMANTTERSGDLCARHGVA